MRSFAIVLCFGAILGGCYAQKSSDGPGVPNEPITTFTEPVAQPETPTANMALVDTAALPGPEAAATDMDAKFAAESRDSGWATQTEQIIDGHMKADGGKAVAAVVCKTTICRGTYRFPSADERKQAWTMGVLRALDFPNHTLRVARPADAPEVEDTFYVVKDPAQVRPTRP